MAKVPDTAALLLTRRLADRVHPTMQRAEHCNVHYRHGETIGNLDGNCELRAAKVVPTQRLLQLRSQQRMDEDIYRGPLSAWHVVIRVIVCHFGRIPQFVVVVPFNYSSTLEVAIGGTGVEQVVSADCMQACRRLRVSSRLSNTLNETLPVQKRQRRCLLSGNSRRWTRLSSSPSGPVITFLVYRRHVNQRTSIVTVGMKIAELLNEPVTVKRSTVRSHVEKRMDMASLDLLTQKRKHRPELSMSRIIQELAMKEGGVNNTLLPAGHVKVSVKVVHHEETQPSVVSSTKAIKKTEGEGSGPEETKTRRRRPRNGFTPLTESEKRVKQRMLVKRSYYRKIDTLVELRNEMEELETKCREVIISRRQIQSPTSPGERPEEEQRRCEDLRERYTQLAITQDDLRHENEKLRSEAMEQSKARTRIGILQNEEMQDQKEARAKGETIGLAPWSPAEPRAASPTSSSENSSQEKANSNPVLDFTPITEDERITIVREAYTDVRAFADKQHYESTGASVFGWRDRRQVDGDTMRFFLEKTFENYTAAEISSRMWDLVSSEHGVNRIYASDVAINFHLVQRVNDENVLFYRTIEPRGVNTVQKALVLASRVQIDDNGSFMVLFRSVDPVARGITKQDTSDASGFSTKKKEVWSDVFSWGLYEAVGDRGQHCRNYFGGFVSSLVTQRSLEFWLMHILLIAVRCENEVIGPLFIMQ